MAFGPVLPYSSESMPTAQNTKLYRCQGSERVARGRNGFNRPVKWHIPILFDRDPRWDKHVSLFLFYYPWAEEDGIILLFVLGKSFVHFLHLVATFLQYCKGLF